MKANIHANQPIQSTKLFDKRGRSRLLTYTTVFLCPPLALYRLSRKDAPFTKTEKIAQVFVTCVYSIVLILELVKR